MRGARRTLFGTGRRVFSHARGVSTRRDAHDLAVFVKKIRNAMR